MPSDPGFQFWSQLLPIPTADSSSSVTSQWVSKGTGRRPPLCTGFPSARNMLPPWSAGFAASHTQISAYTPLLPKKAFPDHPHSLTPQPLTWLHFLDKVLNCVFIQSLSTRRHAGSCRTKTSSCSSCSLSIDG